MQYWQHHLVFFRCVSLVVLLCFDCMILDSTVRAAEQAIGNASNPTSSRPAINLTPARLFEDLTIALDRLNQAIQTPNSEAIGRYKTELTQLRIEMAKFDGKLHAHAKGIEERIQAQGLPQIFLDRLNSASGIYQEEFNKLDSSLEAIRVAQSPLDSQEAIAQASQQLKAYREKLKSSFDPARLPNRVSEGKTKAPRSLRLSKKPSATFEGGQGFLPKGPQATATEEYLQPGGEVMITPEIQALADSLDNHPVKIRNWVYNNIEYVPGYGAMQRSDQTLRIQRGNAFDISSLLIALLRASNIPARYAYGTIDMPMDLAQNWLGGISSPENVLRFLSQAKIPNTGIVVAGEFVSVQMDHVWVEAWVDFVPSNAAINRQGDTWIPLDVSFKRHEFQEGMDIFQHVPFDPDHFDQFLQSGQYDYGQGWSKNLDQSLMESTFTNYNEQVQAYIQSVQPGEVTINDVLGFKKIRPIDYPVLFEGFPYSAMVSQTQPMVTSAKVAVLPDSLRNRITVQLYNSRMDQSLERPSLTHTLNFSDLGTKRLGITYQPASPEDADLWDSYRQQGAQTLPAFLLKVKPVLMLDGETLVSGSVVGMGEPQYMDVVFHSPGKTTTTPFTATAGDEMVIGVDAAGITPDMVQRRIDTTNPGTAAENLHLVALHYWMELDVITGIAARANGVHYQRMPSVGLFSSPLMIDSFFGIPVSVTYRSRRMDVALELAAVVADDHDTFLSFMHQKGITGSYLEGSVFDQLFLQPQGSGISAAQLLLEANQQGIPIHVISEENRAESVPLLNVSGDTLSNINFALNSGKWVIIPREIQTHGAWTGSGYVILDPTTGAGAYLIEGGLNGGIQDDQCGQRSTDPVRAQLMNMAIAKALAAMIILGILWVVLTGGRGVRGATALATIFVFMVRQFYKELLIGYLVFGQGLVQAARPKLPNCDSLPSAYQCDTVGEARDVAIAWHLVNNGESYVIDPDLDDDKPDKVHCPNQGRHVAHWVAPKETGGAHPSSSIGCACCDNTGGTRRWWAVSIVTNPGASLESPRNLLDGSIVTDATQVYPPCSGRPMPGN